MVDDSKTTVWWAEGAYKIRKNDAEPQAASKAVSLFAARNECEPFIIVLRPKERLDRVRVECSLLAGPGGKEIAAFHISVCHVGYVNVVVPTDAAGAAGEDPSGGGGGRKARLTVDSAASPSNSLRVMRGAMSSFYPLEGAPSIGTQRAG